MSGMIDLRSLPPDHPARNAPLVDIHAETRLPPGGWRQITAGWGIAKNTYNDLGPAWLDNESEWRALEPVD